MKQFEDYKDGDFVIYNGHVYELTKSQITHGALKLKSHHSRPNELVDVSEVIPNNTDYYSTVKLPSSQDMTLEEFNKRMDTDADSSGIYHVHDDGVQD